VLEAEGRHPPLKRAVVEREEESPSITLSIK